MKALAHKFGQFSTLIVIIISNRVVLLRKLRHSQPRLGTRKINGTVNSQKERFKKTRVLSFVID